MEETDGSEGTTIKALIHEKFGEGIMSAIDFELGIERVEDPKGDRVKVIYNWEVPALPEVVISANLWVPGASPGWFHQRPPDRPPAGRVVLIQEQCAQSGPPA